MPNHRRSLAGACAVWSIALVCSRAAADELYSGLALSPPSDAVPWMSSLTEFSTPTADESASAVELTHDSFTEGARYWSLTLGTSHDPDIGRIYLSQFSINDYIRDDLAFHYGVSFGFADADRTDGGFQGGPEIGLRWHFFTRNDFSTYIDGSVAAVFHENPLTEESLRFNFDLQAGLGATFRLNDETMIRGGARWHHLSNARIRGKARNLGYDAPMLYIGLMRSF